MELELLTTRELMKKWGINAVKLYQLIENGLPVYLEQGTPDYPNQFAISHLTGQCQKICWIFLQSSEHWPMVLRFPLGTAYWGP